MRFAAVVNCHLLTPLASLPEDIAKPAFLRFSKKSNAAVSASCTGSRFFPSHAPQFIMSTKIGDCGIPGSAYRSYFFNACFSSDSTTACVVFLSWEKRKTDTQCDAPGVIRGLVLQCNDPLTEVAVWNVTAMSVLDNGV